MKLQLLLILCFSLFIITPLVFADEEPQPKIVYVNTDKEEYSYGETVYLTGEVEQVIDGIVFSVENEYNTSSPDTIEFTNGTNFSYEFILDDPISIKDGRYFVKIFYGDSSNSEYFILLHGPFQFELDKYSYYLNNPILVSGTLVNFNSTRDMTITWNIYESDILVSSASNEYMNESGTFSFTIPTDNDDPVWNETASYFIVLTFQDFLSNQVNFSYYDEVDKTNDGLYSLIVINEDSIRINDDKFTDMMYSYDDRMINLDTTVNIQNGTLYTIQYDLESLKRQFDGLERFPIEVNATLIDYPAILADNTLIKITGEMDRVNNEISRTGDAIIEKMLELDQARNDENDELAEKLEEALGSLILSREMRQTQMSVYDAYFEMYPQN